MLTSGIREGLYAAVIENLNLDVPVIAWAAEEGVDDDVLRERLEEAADKQLAEKQEAFGMTLSFAQVQRQVLLSTIDSKWREHLLMLEHLRSVVSFRGYAQRDPLNEYKNEAFQLFESLLNGLRVDVTQQIGRVRPLTEEERQAMMQQMLAQQIQAQVDLLFPYHHSNALRCLYKREIRKLNSKPNKKLKRWMYLNLDDRHDLKSWSWEARLTKTR